ncbi:fimbria/pilus outer membrane usher protein [Luteibacter sp. 329MFSha]|uniref:fimbria/pilus outer membrane usher protein n=1 Tax=Luteibacter sp. 329MFSha TaxID=1798239 RepID=UPI0008B84037|nr:fimbria/pilus outer membrane usher protein [Luteibacter sp. 329MFSha]SEW28533.1 outer membrane usher protein [Luteibacter sp. 329MFSha]
MIHVRRTTRFTRRPLALALALLGPAAADAAAIDPVSPDPAPEPAAPQATFNSSFLHSSGGAVDLSRFERGNVTLAGTYRPTVHVNGQPLPGSRSIAFRHVANSESAQPCFDRNMLVGFGLDTEKLRAATEDAPATRPLGDAAICGNLGSHIPGATVDFDESEQVLRITIPQAFMRSQARGYVDPEFWEQGENVALLNYNANTFQVRRDGQRSTRTYVGIQAGANLGGWRLRQLGSLSIQSGRSQWQNTQMYAQHDLTAARAQLTVGESYTSGDILDSVRIRGVSLVSDPRMLPASQRGYAPVIRGVAESNAQVTIRQNGYIIHSTSVAPGAFEIDDLYPTGFGSDLEVTITEADGRTKTILVPYTSVPQMLREGGSRFGVWAGQVDETSVSETPFIAQGTFQYGLTNTTTVYAGTTASNSYWSGLLGAAVNTPIGAFALDVTGSRAAFRREGVRRGASTRLRYTRSIASTGTNFGVAAQRFSTRDYLGVADAARVRSLLRQGYDTTGVGGERSRFDANIGQTIGTGRLSLAGSLVDYWGGRSRGVNYTLAYGNSWRSINYNVSVQRSRIGDLFGRDDRRGGRRPGTDTTVYLSLSVPLGTAVSAPNFGVTHNRGNDGDASTQATLNGRAGDHDDVSYTLAASRSESRRRPTSHSGSASVGYRGFAGTYRAGASRSSGGSTQYSLSATGAVVAHRDGITLAQELGETNAIIHAPGAAGARIESHAGARIDRYGNAVVRSLMPYQLNTLSIDPIGASHDVELESTSESVAPRAGAFVRLEYNATVADSLLILATRPDGGPLPFGASVYDDAGQPVGVVGQASRIFARGALAGRQLTVSWGDGESEGGSCRILVPTELEGLETKGMHRSIKAACVDSGPGLAMKKAA